VGHFWRANPVNFSIAPKSQTGGSAPAEKPLRVEKTRGLGQCEIFLLKGEPEKLEALVYNTTGLNDCPPGKFDPIDPEQVAKKAGPGLEEPPALLDDGRADGLAGRRAAGV
jgi:hypothetical protein